MKTAALGLAILFAAATTTAFAGVTPNSATSMLQRSGAKIAQPKSDSKGDGHGDSATQSDQAK